MTIFIFVSEHSRKHDNFYIRFTSTTGNVPVFIFGSHALPKIWQFLYSVHKHFRKYDFFIRFTSTLGNMAIFILGSQTLPKT